MKKSPNPNPQTSIKHIIPGFKVKVFKSKLKPNTKASRLVITVLSISGSANGSSQVVIVMPQLEIQMGGMQLAD